MKKDTLSLQLPIALLSKSKVTMRALLEREVAQQESYIKETLKAIEIPFKGTLHPKIDRMETVFSIKMKPYFSEDDFEKVQKAFPKGYVLPHSNFVAEEVTSRFVRIAIPNQTTHFVCLSEIFSSKQFKQSAMPLPIALGMNEKDLHLINLATEAHLAIQADDPTYRRKLQQLVLLSLLYKHSPETLKIVWIGGADDCPPAMLQVIAPYTFSTATDTEVILQALVDENQKRTENALTSPYIVVFINEADTLFEKHFLLLNVLKDSQAQGIYIVGISEVFERKSITVKQLLDYRLLFNNLLWVHEEGAVGYERTSLLLPFFEEEVFENIVQFRERKIETPPEEAQTIEKQIALILKNRKNVLFERSTLKDLKKSLLTPLIKKCQLCSTDRTIVVPLNIINEKVEYPLLDTLPNATYPQLSLIAKKLRGVEPIPSNLEEKALLVHKLFNNSIFTWQLSPIALLSEIEMLLLRIDFELINKKFLRTRQQTALNS